MKDERKSKGEKPMRQLSIARLILVCALHTGRCAQAALVKCALASADCLYAYVTAIAREGAAGSRRRDAAKTPSDVAFAFANLSLLRTAALKEITVKGKEDSVSKAEFGVMQMAALFLL